MQSSLREDFFETSDSEIPIIFDIILNNICPKMKKR